MDLIEKKTGEVSDCLYVAGVRSDERLHLDVYPSAKGDEIVISVHPNHWRCDDCRSKGLVQKVIAVITKGSSEQCSGCLAKNEENSFHARAKLAAIVAALSAPFTLSGEHSSTFGSAYAHVKV